MQEVDTDVKYNLIYFPIKALAEPIRFLLSYGKFRFEDTRIDREIWKTMKEETPFGQIPILEIDGKKTHQSVAICRYLGNVVKLAGDTFLENLEIDSVVDTITDLRSRISTYNKEDNNSPNKMTLRENLFEDALPFYLTRLNDIAANGHLALDKLTWADLYFIGILDYCNGVLKQDIIENYTNLNELRNEVNNIPTIKAWIDKRPESDY